jgi:predicted dinucleotide-binding enzyme
MLEGTSMNIAVLGTGTVGRTIAGKLAELGHEVVVGTRDPQATLARTDPDAMGNPPYAAWQADHPAVRLAPFAEAAALGELVVNATGGGGSLDALRQAGADNLAGKVLLDVSNPLDFSQGFPPSLFVKDTDSLAEQIQRAFSGARVVKSLNTMTAAVMVDPGLAGGGDHSVFVSGDDPGAKQAVVSLLEDFGHTDVIDLGDLSTARGAEMYLPLWLRLMGAVGTPFFNIKVVR